MRYSALLLIITLICGCGVTPKTVNANSSPSGVTEAFMHELFKSNRDLLRDQDFKRRYFSQRMRQTINRAYKVANSAPPSQSEPWAGLPLYEDRFNTTTFDASDTPTSYTMGDSRVVGGKATVEVTYLWGVDTKHAGDKRLNIVDLVYEEGAWRIDDLINQDGEAAMKRSLRTSLEKESENKS